MTNIDDLPADDIFPIIFRNLPINDLFNCRLVSKKFKNFSDNSKFINKLVVIKSNLHENNLNYWIYNNETIKEEEAIDQKCFKKMISLSLFNLDTNLKYLKIIKFNGYCLNELLSNLENLEVLEISESIWLESLELNKLKILILENKSDLTLNAPKLEKIQYHNFYKLKFINSSSIKHLILSKYWHFSANKFNFFKNLKILEVYIEFDLKRSLLSDFNYLDCNLEKIKLYHHSKDANDIYYDLKNGMNATLEDRKKFKKNIDIYLEDIKIIDIDKFQEIKSYKYLIEYQVRNYELLDSNSNQIKSLDYNQFERCLNYNQLDQLSTLFNDLLQNISSIQVMSPVINPIYFDWFLENLKGLKNLKSLDLKYVSIEHFYLNNLHDTIEELIIYDEYFIDFNFISKFSNLILFKTSNDKDLFEFALESFKNLKYLTTFEFHFANDKIQINRLNNQYNLSINDKIKKEKLSSNELVKLFEKIRPIKYILPIMIYMLIML